MGILLRPDLDQNRRALLLLTVIDEHPRERLAMRAICSIRSSGVIETLAELMTARGAPATSAQTTARISLVGWSANGSAELELVLQRRISRKGNPRGGIERRNELHQS